jgi:uncharacterized protein YbjT (DUF2867 family)
MREVYLSSSNIGASMQMLESINYIGRPTMTRVLITGVRGKTGAPLAELLVARPGVDILGGSSDPSSITIEGVSPTSFSWDAPSGWAAATDGVDAVYLVRPDRADAPELVAALLAETPRDARIVQLSEWDADSFAPGSWALRVEQAVRESGHAWTMLRPSWFMQVFTDPRYYGDEIAQHGRLPFPGGGASVAWIDARDIAAVAERALLDEGHDGQIYELAGPEAITLPRTAEVLSRALGRPVSHVEITIADAVADMPEGFERDEFVWTFERLHDGVFSGVTDAVEQVTGRPARTLARFLAD